MFISITYILFRLLFISQLPLFNDESIYLNWGWKELHTPGALFYSLYDGKPPFLMWIFGIAESIISDPLLAGRLVAISGGLITMIGIYTLGKKYFSLHIAVISSLLYMAIPIFTTFDRLALMESAISACGVWSVYYLLKVLKGHHMKDAFILGLILGIGFSLNRTQQYLSSVHFSSWGFIYWETKVKKEYYLNH